MIGGLLVREKSSNSFDNMWKLVGIFRNEVDITAEYIKKDMK